MIALSGILCGVFVDLTIYAAGAFSERSLSIANWHETTLGVVSFFGFIGFWFGLAMGATLIDMSFMVADNKKNNEQ